MTVKEISDSIKQNNILHRKIIIAVDGYGGSGKTTFSRLLAAKLTNAYIVNIDDFIVKEKLAEPAWDTGIFDIKRLETQVLRPATENEQIAYNKLIWDKDTLSSLILVPEFEYLIVEGISAYRPDIERYYDYKIWVEATIEVASRRAHQRQGSINNKKYWDLWKRNDIEYEKKYTPKQRADFIYNNG